MTAWAVDSHVHIFDTRYPLSADRNYDPEPGQLGSPVRLAAVLASHGLSHALLVQAEPYRFDNSALLRAIADFGGRYKGIALVPPDIGETELLRLHDAGVVGIRFNLTSFGTSQFEHPATPALLARLQRLGMVLQIHCEHDQLAAVLPMLRQAPVRSMIDHWGRPDLRKGLDQPGFAALLELGRRGNAVIKLSGAFRSSLAGPPYADVAPFIAAAVEAFTLDNCVWGSDWPFVKVDERIDYGPEFDCVARYFPDRADREKVLWHNPARLFGFAPLSPPNAAPPD